MTAGANSRVLLAVRRPEAPLPLRIELAVKLDFPVVASEGEYLPHQIHARNQQQSDA